MNYRYEIVHTYYGADKTHPHFGLALMECYDNEIRPLRTFADLSLNRQDIEHLVADCNRFQLSPIHLMDVIEDFLE